MRINNNLLLDNNGLQFPFNPSENQQPDLTPRFLIMHYTAGSSARAAIEKLSDTSPPLAERVSAHLVISRTGEITQLVPFDKIAWHTGFSFWENEPGINRFSIGIELDNEGFLKFEDGQWRTPGGTVFSVDKLKITSHRKEERELGWVCFNQIQLEVAFEAAKSIIEEYHLIDILGHDDIHEQKVDPGPAFPMEDWRRRLFGRSEPLIQSFKTIRRAQIFLNQEGNLPSVPAIHPASPLPVGTKVKVLKRQKSPDQTPWALVSVNRTPSGLTDVQGWVKGENLRENKIGISAPLFDTGNAPPQRITPPHPANPLELGTPIRRLETRSPWTFICTLKKLPRHGFVYAWVREREIAESQSEL
jgi:N-acetylmuramoyl-L-alanine amidase